MLDHIKYVQWDLGEIIRQIEDIITIVSTDIQTRIVLSNGQYNNTTATLVGKSIETLE